MLGNVASKLKNLGNINKVVYNNDETLEIKEEIIEIEYIDEEALGTKEEIIKEKSNCDWRQSRIRSTGEYKAFLLDRQREHNNLLFKNRGKKFTCEIEYSNDETFEIKEEMIETEYNDDETLKMKEEIIEDQENKSQKCDQKFYTMDMKDTHNVAISKKLPSHNNDKIRESEQEPQKKYKCKKCARSYKLKKLLNHHLKYECDVSSQFICKFCGKIFKRKTHMNTHLVRVHHEINMKTSALTHKCDKCWRSYNWLSGLCRHKRIYHANVKSQFICDLCGHKTNQKNCLEKHITSLHLETSKTKHDCNMCSRSYTSYHDLTRHKRLVHPTFKAQFTCDFCEHTSNRKNKQNAKSESKKLSERPDVGPYSCTEICFENYSYANTSTKIEYDIDESLEIKEETIEDQSACSNEVVRLKCNTKFEAEECTLYLREATISADNKKMRNRRKRIIQKSYQESEKSTSAESVPTAMYQKLICIAIQDSNATSSHGSIVNSATEDLLRKLA
ncbi:zinc finger protein 681-like [Belonocnema kinseyi]|uniref:zinc finger protein 681-like n=1 Tax=Belonocnema kinseyi TaxID=2817044 RepID=UPI00143D07C0|nr:zinc finger protein 681-like [Belonocnema kinseyi]